MKPILILLFSLFSAKALAVTNCEATVVPLAFQMAKASGQYDLIKKLYIDVSADYSEINVTLVNYDYSRESKFKMSMGEDYKLLRKCIVTKVEAI